VVKERIFAENYRIFEVIGKGGMAGVYLAKHLRLERLVAVKIIHPHLLTNSDMVTMFHDEARTAGQLKHSNVVHVDDFGQAEGIFYIVMEYVHGCSLRAALEVVKTSGEQFPLDLALYVMSEACKGLDHAHRKIGIDGKPLNIIHRDVDPLNILLSFKGEVKISDFGIAKTDIQTRITETGALIGKIPYMSPEMFKDLGLDQRTDIFSLGVVFYELVTGQQAFTKKNQAATIDSICGGKYVPVCRQKPDIPVEVCDAVEKALAIDRDDRFQSASEMLAEIERLRSKFGLVAGAGALSQILAVRFPEKSQRPTPSTPFFIPCDPSDPLLGLSGQLEEDLATTEPVLDSQPNSPGEEKPAATPLETKPSPGEARSRNIGMGLAVMLSVIIVVMLAWFKPWTTKEPGGEVVVATSLMPDAESLAVPSDETLNPTPPKSMASTKSGKNEKVPDISPVAPKTKQPIVEPPELTPEPISLKAPEPGFLSINSDVGCKVFLDGKPVGETPIASLETASGNHLVLIKNDVFGYSKTLSAKVEPGKSSHVSAKFLAFLDVNAAPWANVYLDSVKIGKTPLKKGRIKPGKHTIRLVNPDLDKEKVISETFVSGQTVHIFRDLQK
jgi:eukaryotic-like serine/threonine-protein kinase